MFLKSAIATIIIMGLTGGFIYWGTDVPLDKVVLAPKSVVNDGGKVEDDTSPKVQAKKTWTDLRSGLSSTTPKDDVAEPKAVVVQVDREVTTPDKKHDIRVARILKTSKLEADKISQFDLKDQAYLRLVDYAVANEKYGEAKSLLVSLSSPQLRDTARSRIAIGMALSGRDRAAFALLKEVEVDALKDVLRLQVIEAATDLSVGVNPSQ
ncbi:MAG: hypothetical protein ABJ275_00445 [Maricaulaceae bacterium]